MAEGSTLSTPFARLAVPPEGCSSVHFARMMGASNAERMLGKEGWQPTAKEVETTLSFTVSLPFVRCLGTGCLSDLFKF